MTLNDYRETYSWQKALELGRPLSKLAEELPAQEQQGLIMALQSSMVELPAAVAIDLVNDSKTRQAAIVRLQTVLEVIERVYPALDTAEAKQLIDQLIERSESDQFSEVQQTTPPATEESVAVEQSEPSEPTEAATEAATDTVTPEATPSVEATAERV